jgi:hypothetical protein
MNRTLPGRLRPGLLSNDRETSGSWLITEDPEFSASCHLSSAIYHAGLNRLDWAGTSWASSAGEDRVHSGVKQELHLQPLEPAGQKFLIASRPGSGAEVDHGLGVPGVAADEPRGPAVVAMKLQDRPGRLGKRAGDGMPADPVEPVGGIAGIGLAAMSNAVPVG